MQENQEPASGSNRAGEQPLPMALPGDIIGVAKAALLSPNQFFRSMPVAGGMGQPITYFAVIAGVNAAMSLLIQLLGHPDKALMAGGGILVGMMVWSFVAAGISMGLCKLFGGTGSYEATYRVVAYANTPALLAWVPFLNVFTSLYSLFLQKLGFERAHNLTSGKAMAVVAIQVGMGIIFFAVVAMVTAAAVMSGVSRGGGL